MSKRKDPTDPSTGESKPERSMSEPTPEDEMPHPTGASSPSKDMPVPGGATSKTRGSMPVPQMAKPTSDTEMAGKPMSEPVAGATMPTGSMSGGMFRATEASRFGPTDLPPGQVPTPQWEPGVVEVEFREGVAPTITGATARGALEVSSPSNTDMSEFNNLVQSYGLQQAELSIGPTSELPSTAETTAREQGIDVPNLGNFVTLHFPNDADTPQIAKELERLDSVVRAVPLPKAIPPQTPLNEPLVGATDQVVLNPATGMENQWYVFRVRANRAWSMSSGAGVVVADIDWGYRISHQDLSSRLDLTRAFNSVDGGTNVSFGGNIDHGTGVMGLVGGADNNLGMAGIAWGSTLWPVQANAGPGPALGGNPWARAIDWVRTTDSGGRRKVIILEVQTGAFGNYEQVPSVNAAIRAAIAAGVVVCVAAGNGNRDAGLDDSGSPIPATGSILVGATAYHPTQNVRAGFSNWGPRIVVCAPGDGSHDVTCAIGSDNAYRNGFGGTSGATPKVAGAVALMLALDPTLTHERIRTLLNTTGGAVVTDAGRPVGTFLNCDAAVRAARTSAPGRLELFVSGSDGALWHKWQTAPSNGWSGWDSLGGWIDQISVGQNADGRLEAFVRGSDQALWHNRQTTPGGGWSGWESLGGWIDLLTSARNADGRLEVFARGSDQALWHKWQTAPNNGWSDWSSLGGWIDRLAMGQNADGRLEIFARGSDQAVWHRWQTAPNNGWSDWSSLGGWIDMLAVGKNADGRLGIFARGSDGAVWHRWQTAPSNVWSDWASLGGWVGQIAIGQNADGRLEIFACGSDNALWHKWQTAPNGWSDWSSLGGWIDRLAVGRNTDGRLEVFARGSDGALWHKWQTAANNGWSDWASLGGWIDILEVGQNSL